MQEAPAVFWVHSAVSGLKGASGLMMRLAPALAEVKTASLV